MEFIIRGDKIKITDAMKSYIEEKLGKLNKYLKLDTVYIDIYEIIDNSLDEGLRTNFKFANKISVNTINKMAFFIVICSWFCKCNKFCHSFIVLHNSNFRYFM